MYCTAAACRNSQENLIRCTEDSVRAGDEMHCVCKNNCRPVSLKCLDDGTLESKNFNYYCTENYQGEKFQLDTGQNVQLSYTYKQFETYYRTITMHCDEGETLTPGNTFCTIGSGDLTSIVPPKCALPCTNIPTGLKCDNAEDVQYQDSRNCNCRNSCRPVTITCLADGIWSDFRQQCSEIYSTWEITSDNEKKVHVSYTPSTLSYLQKGTLRAQCPTNIRTTYEGTIKCNDGEINLTKPPSCELPCTNIPAELKCSNAGDAQYRDSRNCNCRNSCRLVTITCNADGQWSGIGQLCSEQYSYNYTEQRVYVSYTPANSYKEKASLKAECPSGFTTISQGVITCNDGEITLTQPPSCELQCITIPTGVKCSNERTAQYGESRSCTCSKSCQTVILTCRADGHWSSPDAQCREPYNNLEIIFRNGAKLYASYSPQTDYPVARCAPGIQTVNPGRVTCSDGNIYVSQRPSCDIPCKTADAGIKCGNKDEFRYNDTRICNYLDTCEPVTATCAADGRWEISHLTKGRNYILKQEIPGDENVRIIFTVNTVNIYFSVRCKLEDTTLTPGSVTCNQGDVSIATLPECGCTTKPPNDLTCEQNKTRHGESINCNCTATCRPVTLTCDADGAWTDVSQLCNEPIARRSDNVVSTFNNGTYVFECVEGHQPISGSHFAVCENGQLNVTEESQLRCQPAAEIPIVLWASAGAAALILVIILIVIAIYCHRRNHGAAVVTEEIGFVTINDRRVPVNPVPASPTSVDAGMEENDLYGAFDGRMEENDLYGAYNGPRNEEVEENELYGAFDGAKNELQMQDDDNMYMNYSGPGDEQMEENECYGAYQGPRRKH